MFRQPMLSLVGLWAVVTIGWFALVSEGGESEFSPHTMETRGRHEYTLLGVFPLYRARWETRRPTLLAFLVEQEWVMPDTSRRPRWICVFHWSESWRDGDGTLYRPLRRDGSALRDWSLADRVRAQHCWTRVFELLRSEDPIDVVVGEEMFSRLAAIQTTAEFDRDLANVRAELNAP